MIVRPVVDALVAEIIDKQIDVLIIDPFVSCHELPENDNTAQDMVVKEWGRVADRGNCAVHLVDHTRKMGGFESEVTTEVLPRRQGQDRRRPGGARRQPDVQGGGREGGGRKPPPLLPDLQRQGQPRAASRQVGLVRAEKRGPRQRAGMEFGGVKLQRTRRQRRGGEGLAMAGPARRHDRRRTSKRSPRSSGGGNGARTSRPRHGLAMQ